MKVLVSLVSLIAFLLVALPGPLYKYGIVDLGTAFTGFKFGVFAGIAALILLVLQMIFKRKTVTLGSTVIALLLSAIAIAMPLSMMNKGKSVPPIHDISTDLINPPKFEAIAPLRADAPNPVEYAGEATAKQQRDAYPDLQTLTYTQSQSELVKATEQAVNNLGWELVNSDADKGIIEATDSTMWFSFKDDVVVRVTDNGSERLLDIRSKSRVGGSDLGKNSERIHDFINELDGVLEE
ncbi:DUF1499 domain-containing protein [Psychrobacter sp. N25K4-3-2]|jgi:uncharacterized protein (DUF1499 family)|uniref:DUF1499 domain-containing protein n=1 Tax=Psychrobacter sp. N25K4-3-2 TaxID=2785026 RepID=UPI00188A467B|nr:DUF1499 domain-containing protein [Psychrobacter sp. N25K4-3-2]MBF4490676.1 DUF1499 domain-containing protein [Psychrobacter sp. N25K4-3-2]